MNTWLVIYYNGRGNREKFFGSREEAIKFLESCKDNTATLWQKEII